MASKQIIWEHNSSIIDSVIVSGNENEIQFIVKKYLLECLTNKPNPILQKDWSAFGASGDCIKIL